jgi:hypothetical protein
LLYPARISHGAAMSFLRNTLILFAPLLIAANLAGATIDAASKGLVAQIEDDVNKGRDHQLKAMRTKGCKTRLRATNRSWTVDWSKAEAVLLEDTFIFIKSPPVQIAIVGDASKPDQWAKLKALYGAMIAKVEACQPTNSNAPN